MGGGMLGPHFASRKVSFVEILLQLTGRDDPTRGRVDTDLSRFWSGCYECLSEPSDKKWA
jgi:hypothetical protein